MHGILCIEPTYENQTPTKKSKKGNGMYVHGTWQFIYMLHVVVEPVVEGRAQTK